MVATNNFKAKEEETDLSLFDDINFLLDKPASVSSAGIKYHIQQNNKQDLLHFLSTLFNNQKEKYPHLVNENTDKVFNEVIPDFISELDLFGLSERNFYISITDSPSIVVTLVDYKGIYKIRFETFIDDLEFYTSFSVYDQEKLFARFSSKYDVALEKLKKSTGTNQNNSYTTSIILASKGDRIVTGRDLIVPST